jgi:A/G-specific adenine glycosylase
MPLRVMPGTRATIQRTLLAWFRAHARDLPWRENRDAYRVWVAEIMLQQTRIGAVLPYYARFLEAFPSIRSLAMARPHKVLKLWAGLGYYSRARNLHRAARKIVKRHAGVFPRTHEAALALPGIGRYTAAAILSIVYDLPVAAVDGNVARVLARLDGVRGDLRESRRWRQLERRAQEIIAVDAPGDWNESLMELGETICTPQTPRCGACPISQWCVAHRRGLAHTIPAARRKRASINIRVAAAVLCDPRGRTLLVRDPGAHDEVLFSRMWQFPAVEVGRDPAPELTEHISKVLQLDAESFELEPLPAARHGVTFRNMTLMPFLVRVPDLPRVPRSRILRLRHLGRLPVSNATRKIAAAASLQEPRPSLA